MKDSQHDQIATWERRWLALSGLMSLTFVLLIAYNLATEGAHIAQRTTKAAPEQILAQDVFANPGVRVLAPGKVQVTTVAQAFVFQPSDVRVPVGAEVEFFLTAADVIHGYQIENTNVNVELIPGEVANLRYTFDRPGVYRITCNEYCGIGHHTMLGSVTVLPASQWNAEQQAGGQAQAAGGEVDGATIYTNNCASCHQANGQGIPGAFPPVAGHAAELIESQGRDYLQVLMLGSACKDRSRWRAPITTASCPPGRSCPTRSWPPSPTTSSPSGTKARLRTTSSRTRPASSKRRVARS